MLSSHAGVFRPHEPKFVSHPMINGKKLWICLSCCETIWEEENEEVSIDEVRKFHKAQMEQVRDMRPVRQDQESRRGDENVAGDAATQESFDERFAGLMARNAKLEEENARLQSAVKNANVLIHCARRAWSELNDLLGQ